MNAKKKLEGQEHIRLAEKALKTSLLKWSPDYDSAGDEFSKAATDFKVAKAYDEALDALDRACDCYKECRSLYQAAKTLEQSVLISRDMGKLERVVDLAERGGLLFRQHGSPESAAQLLEKAAKILEPKQPDKALTLYEKAAETILVEDRVKVAAEYMTKVCRLYVKSEKYPEAAESCRKTISMFQESGFTHTTGRIVAGYVLIELASEDIVAATKAFHDFGGYCDADISTALGSLLQAFNDEDPQAAKSALNSSAIKNLDVEFAILAKKIKVPEGGDGIEAAAAAMAATNLKKDDEKEEEQEQEDNKDDEEEEEEEGLC